MPLEGTGGQAIEWNVLGCARKPIMNIMQHLGIVTILVVVKRYYEEINQGLRDL